MNRLLVPALLLCGCLGKVDPTVSGQPGDPSWTGGPDQPGAPSTAILGARRLTRAEYVQTVRDLVDAQAPVTVEALAIDEGVPFDNDITMQHASEVLVDATDTIAEQVAVWAMTQPAVKARLYGCTPTGPADGACFAAFVDRMGRRALRRPLTDPERQAFTALQSESVADASFDSGAELVLRALLSHPGLLFRFEPGVAKSTDGEITLSGYEIATRLSYLLLGSTPDDALLDAAARGDPGRQGGRGGHLRREWTHLGLPRVADAQRHQALQAARLSRAARRVQRALRGDLVLGGGQAGEQLAGGSGARLAGALRQLHTASAHGTVGTIGG